MSIVYSRDVQMTMAGVEEDEALPNTVSSLEILDDAARLEMRQGFKGIRGTQGDPAYAFEFQGAVALQATLDAMTMTFADKGKAWWVSESNEFRLWNGRFWIAFADAMGATGHQGPPNVLSGTATAGSVGSSAAAVLTGTSPNQVLELTIPRGATGATGDTGSPGRIQDASDVDQSSQSLNTEMVLQWNSTTSKFEPKGTPTWRGPWQAGGARWIALTNAADFPRTIATVTAPALPYAWRPMITGLLTGHIAVAALGDSRIDIDVRMGSQDGEIVAYGQGFPSNNWHWCKIQPKFAQVVSPASTNIGVVAAGVTMTFFVRAFRVQLNSSALANFTNTNDVSRLTVYAMPLHS